MIFFCYRVTYESLERFLRGKGRKMWTERANKIAIVLVDCGSTSSEVSSDTGLPLVQLRDAIHKVYTMFNVLISV